MSAQPKISKFYNSVNRKRKHVEESEKDGDIVANVGTHVPMTAKQKLRCDENRMKAKQKLKEKMNKLSSDDGLLLDVGKSWYDALKGEFCKDYFKKLETFLGEERSQHTVFPPANQVFAWTNTCTVDQVKVVILGQDPYHNVGQAHGLCFSVVRGVALPPSLDNIFKELSTDIKGFSHPGHGDLTAWATQGVLLLNAVLTVRAHQANSHKDKGWEQFTDAVISHINEHLSGVVFLLWGSYAQKKGSSINKKKHHVLKTVHPSPLSAYRGFFGCKHFSQTNELLQKSGKTPIDWNRLSVTE